MKEDGKNLQVFLDGKAVALSTSCSFSITAQFADAKTKDDPVGPYAEFDYADWSVSTESIYGVNDGVTSEVIADTLEMYAAEGRVLSLTFERVMDGRGKVPQSGWRPNRGEGVSRGWQGQAYIESVTVNAPAQGKATVSVNFKAAGPISRVDSEATTSEE